MRSGSTSRRTKKSGQEPLETTLVDLTSHLARAGFRPQRIESIIEELLRTDRVRLIGTFCDYDWKALARKRKALS